MSEVTLYWLKEDGGLFGCDTPESLANAIPHPARSPGVEARRKHYFSLPARMRAVFVSFVRFSKP